MNKNFEEIVSFMSAGSTNLSRFQGIRPDHVQVENTFIFPRELVSFAPPRE